MVELRAIVILAVLMALTLPVVGHKNRNSKPRHYGPGYGGGHGYKTPCTDDPDMYPYFPPCSTTSTSTTPIMSTETSAESSVEDSSEEIVTSTSASSTANTEEPSSLERAHWCRLSNGTYLPLGYSYMHTVCSLCQCTKSRSVQCQLLKCVPTYCVDNKFPVRKPGQCCTQCDYDPVTNATCAYNGLTYPHGAVMKTEQYKMQCWCYLGNVECRKYIPSIFQGLDGLADVAGIYIVMMAIFVIVIFGLLLFSGILFVFYYYYQRNQQIIQEAYDQYINPPGWQPVEEDEENALDPSAEDKHMEAEKYQYSNFVNDAVPPPYTEDNSPYVSEKQT